MSYSYCTGTKPSQKLWLRRHRYREKTRLSERLTLNQLFAACERAWSRGRFRNNMALRTDRPDLVETPKLCTMSCTRDEGAAELGQ